MENLWKWALGIALVSLLLGILAHFGLEALWKIASASAFLRFTDTCLLLAILLLLAGKMVGHKEATSTRAEQSTPGPQ